MKRSPLHHDSSALRFTLPVIAENILTSALGLVYSSVIGGVSASSLAAAGTGNQAMNFISSMFSCLSAGSSILVSRMTGHGDKRETSRIVERTMFMAPVLALIVAAALLLVSSPLTRLLMPGASETFFKEGLVYLQMTFLSLPGLIVYNALTGILRASGDSKAALAGAFVTNVTQLLAAVLFIRCMNLGIYGAGAAMVVCRYLGAATVFISALRHRRSFSVSPSGILHPVSGECLRILRVGLPSTFDSLAVHSGYLLINTLLIGLGQKEASVYSVLAALLTLTGICQAIASSSSTTLVGHKVGAGDLAGGRRTYLRILITALAATVVLCLTVLVFPKFFVSFFAEDAAISEESASLLWALAMFSIPAVAVNASEPAARVGGELKSIMFSSIICVWAVRVPLTWLFCYPMNLGVMGVFLANTLACWPRAIVAFLMIYRKRWGVRKL